MVLQFLRYAGRPDCKSHHQNDYKQQLILVHGHPSLRDEKGAADQQDKVGDLAVINPLRCPTHTAPHFYIARIRIGRFGRSTARRNHPEKPSPE